MAGEEVRLAGRGQRASHGGSGAAACARAGRCTMPSPALRGGPTGPRLSAHLADAMTAHPLRLLHRLAPLRCWIGTRSVQTPNPSLSLARQQAR